MTVQLRWQQVGAKLALEPAPECEDKEATSLPIYEKCYFKLLVLLVVQCARPAKSHQ